MIKWLGLIALTGTTLACLPKGEESASVTPKPLVKTQATNLTRLYTDTCAKCHGQKGEGGGAGTKTMITREKYDQKYDKPYFDAIKNGVTDMGMEAYGPTMDDVTIWGLVVHIRELQGKGLREEFGGPKETNGVYPSMHGKYRLETVIEEHKGLVTPWSLDWLPDGKMLVTNRPGELRLFKGSELGPAVTGMPETRELGQGGLMEVAVHPDYAMNGWIYLSITDPSKTDPKAGMTKIVRGKLKIDGLKASWYGQQTIFESKQEFYNGSGVHFGGKIVFDRKGHVFFSHGERGSGELAQDLSRPNGKIHRVNEDGTIPSDNPFIGDPKNLPSVWSYGHRNPQGLVMDLDGTLWDTEHGPRGGDEVNRIQKGANYGWPIISTSINYNDSPLVMPWPKPGQNFTESVFRWLPSIGASGLDVVKGAAFPDWKGDLVAGGLSGANVDRFRIKDDKVIEHEELVFGKGRVRDVAVGPDGMVYIALNQPDKVIRLVPVK